MTKNFLGAFPLGISRAAFFLRECLFPFGCAACGAGLASPGEARLGLCDGCRAALEGELGDALAGESCGRCGRPLVSERGICLPCRRAAEAEPAARPALDGARALLPYAGRRRSLLAAYKYGGCLALGNFFAGKMLGLLEGGAFPPAGVCGPGGICAVPVPPRPGKTRSAGWDQVDYLARLLERGAGSPGRGLPASRCLRRLPSESQKGLGRDGRRANLRGRIVPSRPAPEVALVIDDVTTTGSTLEACAAALKEGGAKAVFALCLFYSIG